jgi:hypothetical protein
LQLDNRMNTLTKQKNSFGTARTIGILLLSCLIISIGAVSVLKYFTIAYVLPTFFAIISFTIAVVLPIRQKRLSIYPFGAVIIGVLFLASSTIKFGYAAFAQNFSIYAQIDSSLFMLADLLGDGLEYMGEGLVLVFVTASRIKQLQTLNKGLLYLGFGFGIFVFVSGVNLLVDMLQHMH